MTTEEAKKELATNCLSSLSNGLDDIPCKKVFICGYFYSNDDEKSDEEVYVYGLLTKRALRSDHDKHYLKVKYACESFLIKYEHKYYFRSIWYEVEQLIEGIRKINNYKEEED